MKKHKCKKCGQMTIPMNLFRFDKTIYEPHLRISQEDKNNFNKNKPKSTQEIVNEFHDSIICMQCLHRLTDKMKTDDFKIRGCEHLNVPGAFIPNVTILDR